jgi:hypothetical protein
MTMKALSNYIAMETGNYIFPIEKDDKPRMVTSSAGTDGRDLDSMNLFYAPDFSPILMGNLLYLAG